MLEEKERKKIEQLKTDIVMAKNNSVYFGKSSTKNKTITQLIEEYNHATKQLQTILEKKIKDNMESTEQKHMLETKIHSSIQDIRASKHNPTRAANLYLKETLPLLLKHKTYEHTHTFLKE